MKTKKKVSFFKVILIIGILVAIAIYILDRLLPKPYSDEDLEDAWREGGDEETPGGESGAEFQAKQPPAADVTYDVNSEEEGEEPEQSASAESGDEDEGAEKEEDK